MYQFNRKDSDDVYPAYASTLRELKMSGDYYATNIIIITTVSGSVLITKFLLFHQLTINEFFIKWKSLQERSLAWSHSNNNF